MPEHTDEWLCQQLAAGTPDALIFADREGRIRLWNPAAAAMFGYRAAEAIGQSLDLIIPERQGTRHWEGYGRVMATGVSRYGAGELLAAPAVRKDGSRLSLEFSIALLHDAAGEVLGAAAVLRDVTERWQRDKALRERLAALEMVAKAPEPSTSLWPPHPATAPR